MNRSIKVALDAGPLEVEVWREFTHWDIRELFYPFHYFFLRLGVNFFYGKAHADAERNTHTEKASSEAEALKLQVGFWFFTGRVRRGWVFY